MRLRFSHFRPGILLALLGLCAAAGPATQPGSIPDARSGPTVLDDPNAFNLGERPDAFQPWVVKPEPFGIDDADNVVFVCSGGDSMAETLPVLRVAVANAIHGLGPTQHFGIVVYHGERVESLSTDDSLMLPTSDNKKLASEFMLKIKAEGNETALPALKAAFKTDPNRIVLICDGELRDQSDIAKWLAENDANKQIRINTVAWGKAALENVEALRRIAERTSGTLQIGLDHPSLPVPDRSLNLWTPPDHHGIGPDGRVFGDGGNARLIVFVCDVTIPVMLQRPTVVKDELNKTVIGLHPIQKFNIIFTGKDKPLMLAGDLVPATPEYKRKTGNFLEDEVKLTPRIDPMAAAEAAFRLRPQLIYLLTDSDFPDNDAVAKRIAELNKGAKVQVNTIYFRRDKETPDVVEVLKKIAGENHGKFRFASDNGTE